MARIIILSLAIVMGLCVTHGAMASVHAVVPAISHVVDAGVAGLQR